jgi:hypothetical protein
MTRHTDTRREHAAEPAPQRNRSLLFSKYPSVEVLADLRATLADERQVTALWQAQFGLDASAVRSILDQMGRDWSALWCGFGYEVDCLACVPANPDRPLETLLRTTPGLAEAIHAFEEKWSLFVPARLTRAAS